MSVAEGYYWIRLFDYEYERDFHEKGNLLDEFYVNGINDRKEVKDIVRKKYNDKKDLKFAKPRKKDGFYVIIMESNKFFYDRFNVVIDSFCFDCHISIKGKAKVFPKVYLGNDRFKESILDDPETYYFCSYDCKYNYHNKVRNEEGEFQEKEIGKNGDVFGYVYQIYNRKTNTYYVGQTKYLPFFRWQEHVKDGSKGEIKDLIFSVLDEVLVNGYKSNEDNQEYLNSLEAWWISKLKQENYDVYNIVVPRITISSLKEAFDEMIRNKYEEGEVDE